MSFMKRYGYLWVTLVLFIGALGGHWTFGWLTYSSEARSRGEPVRLREYVFEMGRDTLENWQSEFLQLIWQVAGLAFLLHVGSPQSKENGERLEAKVDFLLNQTEAGARAQKQLDRQFVRNLESLHQPNVQP